MNKITNILAIGFVIILLLFLQQCGKNSSLEEKAKIDHQNWIASVDSVRVIKNRLGEEISVKNSFIASEKELKALNEKLYNDVKKLEGKVITAQSSTVNVVHDVITVTNEVKKYPDGTNELKWKFDTTYTEDNGRSIAGFSRFMIDSTGKILDRGTTISRDEIRIKILTGVTELDDSFQIFVKTDYPNLKVEKMDGAILDKKRFMMNNESRWVIGPYAGVGIGYNTFSRTITPNYSIGFGVTFNLNKQIKRIFRR
jgi:hypothetical protein